jgi:sialic acid synthase SpsE
MKVGNREIGTAHPPFVVAEIGAGWLADQPLTSCLSLIQVAKKAGASAVKIQLYKPEDLTVEGLPPLAEGLWQGRTLWEIYREGALPEEIVPRLFEEAARLDIPLFASVFSPRVIPLLESLGCPAYKIAAAEVTHTELLEAVNATGKPVIMSTGLATEEEIARAMAVIYPSDYALLHSVSTYPTQLEDAGLGRLEKLKGHPRCPLLVGLSDHSNDALAAVAAVAMGATIIEKHIAQVGSLDAGFALRPYEFDVFVKLVNQAWEACKGGAGDMDISKSYIRRSVRAIRDIAAGEEFTRENIGVARPNGGAHPSQFEAALGSRAIRDVKQGEGVFPDGLAWRG